MTSSPLSGWIDAALVGTACVALLVPAFRLFRVRPALRHLAWLIVALRFLVPAAPGWSWQPLGERVDAWVGALAPTAMSSPRTEVPTLRAVDEGRADEPDETTRIWIQSLAVLWVASALTLVSVRLGRYARWRRDVGRGTQAPYWLEQDVRVTAERFGIAAPRLVISPRVNAPVVAGLFRPLLVWPAEMRVPLDPPARRAVVAHEMAHLRRRDLWTGWIELLVTAVWWWYPPARHVCKELSAAAEEACDRWVLSLYPEQRRSYAETLYAFAAAPLGPVAPRLTHSVSAKVMERRLEGVARDRGAPRTRLVERALVLVGAFLILPAGVLTGTASPLGTAVSEMAGILGRGDVRVTSGGAPISADDGWIVAFHTDADGGFRAVFATARGATAVDGRGERSAVKAADRGWIERLARETRWSVEPGSRLSASGALVPAGPHVHLTSEGRTLAMWSGVAAPFDDRGRLGAEASEAHPVVAALWSTGEPLRLYRFWRDRGGRVRGERYGPYGRTELADAAAVAADVGAGVLARRNR